MPKITSRDALIDTRPNILKDKDYLTTEIASTSAIEVFANKQILKFTIAEFNQWYTSSCVPHAFLVQLIYEGIAKIDVSPLRAYRKRSNYPAEGSNGVDMYNQFKSGQSNDLTTPEKATEKFATDLPYIAGIKIIKEFSFFQYLNKGTDQILIKDIPADVASGKAVTIFIYATDAEWSQKFVELQTDIKNPWDAEVRHAVCLVPKGDFTKDGKRWLTVQDSAKFGKRGIRYVEFDTFMKKRCYFAAKVYATGAVPTVPVPQTGGLPTEPCELNDKGIHVTVLQTFLVKQKKLGSEYITGYYGALTAKAVLWWQLENASKFTATIPELLEWAGKYWGMQSIKIIKK